LQHHRKTVRIAYMTENAFLPRAEFQRLLDALRHSGYRCIGPQVRDGAIVYETLTRADELPRGVTAEQGPGRYRIGHQASPRWFAWANGPQAIKPHVFAAREPLWQSQRDANGALQFTEARPATEPLALIGVRACDLAALNLQDQHFTEGAFPDPAYAARRQGLLLVAVNCTHPAATCFCASTGDGPRAVGGFDLVLSEHDDGFLVESGSPKGRELLVQLHLAPAEPGVREACDAEIEQAARVQTRSLPSRNLREALFRNVNHKRWEEVGARCLSCGNCTSVCPTCFCHAQVEEPALNGEHSVHLRLWDSCFTQGHSYIHGMTIRAETRMRYRQWLTHKLASWHEQYGRSGCVGCGRCIAWCPVGIDITEETAAICGGDGA
jgi:sulfhydrogenase subunit beta (sulfur reductase)